MDFPILDIEFTKDGAVFAPAQQDAALAAAANATDVIVIAHGWNNDMADARQLYADFFGQARQLLDREAFADLRQRRFVALQVFWPSKKFTDAELIPGGGAASLADATQLAQVEALLDELAVEPLRLGGTEVNPLRKQKIEQAKRALPNIGVTPDAAGAFVQALRDAFPPDAAEPDDGSTDIYAIAPQTLFEDLDGPVVAPLPVHQGGGAAGMAGASPAAGLGDLLSGPLAVARRVGNYFTYYDMKQRAGKVGQLGVAPLVAAIRAADTAPRVHLVGHSFGGRLVTAAALAAGTDGISLTLLQAALSHNALAENFDSDGHDGAFHKLLSNGHPAGPIVITHTKNDRAVGVAYPLASRFARDKSSALGARDDPYGGMGRNGAQHLDSVNQLELDTVNTRLAFARDAVTNLLVDRVVAHHSDITNPFVVGAVLNVMRA